MLRCIIVQLQLETRKKLHVVALEVADVATLADVVTPAPLFLAGLLRPQVTRISAPSSSMRSAHRSAAISAARLDRKLTKAHLLVGTSVMDLSG